MRLLVVTNHFYERQVEGDPLIYISRIDPLARIAAVNASFVALHRHFGEHRYGRKAAQRLADDLTEHKLDIVVLQVPGKGLLDHIGIDPSSYTLELWNGPPMMLGFEAQRVLRERAGQYDYYGIIEDDMVIHDPTFFDKLAWFEQQFGPTRLLQPLRYEMAQTGLPAKIVRWPDVSKQLASVGIRRPGQTAQLSGTWLGRKQTFILPDNPHTGGLFVSDRQLTHWMSTPWFYDRDASFSGPLESAMTLSIGRAFDLYQPSAPDPFFLSIEHWGTRYARGVAPPGHSYGDTPLLEIAYRAVQATGAKHGSTGEPGLDVLEESRRGLNALMRDRDEFEHKYVSLKNSRSKLLKALWAALVQKWRR
jgi:hypothetical protein